MSEKKQSIELWEKEANLLFTNITDDGLKKEITSDEFQNTIATSPFIGMNHSDRIKFLKDNGYEVTRENMANPELSVKQPSEG